MQAMTGTVERASAARYIDDLASRGRYHFTLAEADHGIAGSPTAVRAALRRLKEKRVLAEPARGFLTILPPEYRKLGCLPPEQFLPQLLSHWKEPYYVALLSAAELHGAAHQRPQTFQVMLRRNRRPLICGLVRVEFLARKDMSNTPVIERNTPRGTLRVATTEATALELVGYADRCGGLDNVATVVGELAEKVSAQALVAEARRAPVVWVQRLGYLLELIGQEKLAAPLVPLVTAVEEDAPLVRSQSRRGAIRNRRWRLAVNAEVEPDL
jgi:predicted transcriptional regulator of viral defense system